MALTRSLPDRSHDLSRALPPDEPRAAVGRAGLARAAAYHPVSLPLLALLTCSDYIANYKGATSDLAPFLGATMVAKVAFNDSAGKHYVTKIEYNAHGPASIYGVWNEA